MQSKIRHKFIYRFIFICAYSQHKQKQIHRYRKQTWLPKGKEGGGGMNQELGISRNKLPYIKQVNNKVLLYSTGNYIQYPAINHNGKEHEKYVLLFSR